MKPRTRRAKRAKRTKRTKRQTRKCRGGNYEKDVIQGEWAGMPMKPPNEVVITQGGQTMSVAAYLRKMNDVIVHGHD